MNDKRYFERIWEEEYYIFDSETISENEFDEKVEYEDYQAFADSMQGDEVVNKLNQLNDENEQLKHRLAISEKANFVTALEEENEQLKQRMRDVAQLLSEEVDVFSDKAIEHDLIAYRELHKLDNKDAYYLVTSTKKAIKMLKDNDGND